MADDRRAALEAIAFGEDVRITPTDRMRALELLQNEPGAGAAAALAVEVASLGDEALDAELDTLHAAAIMRLATDDRERGRSPESWKALEQAVRILRVEETVDVEA